MPSIEEINRCFDLEYADMQGFIQQLPWMVRDQATQYLNSEDGRKHIVIEITKILTRAEEVRARVAAIRGR